jgi:hypothetical protein
MTEQRTDAGGGGDERRPAAGVPGLANVRRLTAHCRRCRHRVGEFLGATALLLGTPECGVVVRQRLSYFCPNCGRRAQWRPGEADPDGSKRNGA